MNDPHELVEPWLSYCPGDGTLLAGSDRWLLIDLPVDAPEVGALWEVMRRHSSGTEILDAIVRRMGITELPAFVLAVPDGDELALLIAGDAFVRSAGDQLMAPSGAPWAHHRVRDSALLGVLGPGAGSQESLPLRSGVVAAATALLTTGGEVVDDPAPTADQTPREATRPWPSPPDAPATSDEAQPRRSRGRLLFSTGESVELLRGVVIGRSPVVPDDASERPHLVDIARHGRHISRMHAEVVLSRDAVLVRDLGSANGTRLSLPGGQAVALVPHRLHQLEPGTIVDLAEVVTFTFEAAP